MKTILVFSGAGLSADSGIQTFRGKDGLWEDHRVEDVADYNAWWKNKELVLRFYEERFNKYKDTKPHEGHCALAKLEQKYKVVHITQNIDNLLEQAGCTEVHHLHGKMRSKKCEWHKDITVLDGDTRHICDYRDVAKEPIKIGDLCPKCGSQLRPDVVFFNEAVDLPYDWIAEYVKEVKYNDGVFICVGTSVQVYPAGYLVSFFSQVPRKYIVDTNPQRVSNYTLLKGTAKEKLPELVETLL